MSEQNRAGLLLCLYVRSKPAIKKKLLKYIFPENCHLVGRASVKNDLVIPIGLGKDELPFFRYFPTDKGFIIKLANKNPYSSRGGSVGKTTLASPSSIAIIKAGTQDRMGTCSRRNQEKKTHNNDLHHDYFVVSKVRVKTCQAIFLPAKG